MAHYAKTTPLERILGFINPEISMGSSGELVYPLPIYLRRDGVVIKLGYLVKRTRGDSVYIVREILARGDIRNITVAIVVNMMVGLSLSNDFHKLLCKSLLCLRLCLYYS